MNIAVSLFLYLSDPDKNNEKGGGFNQTGIVLSDVKYCCFYNEAITLLLLNGNIIQ